VEQTFPLNFHVVMQQVPPRTPWRHHTAHHIPPSLSKCQPSRGMLKLVGRQWPNLPNLTTRNHTNKSDASFNLPRRVYVLAYANDWNV
jgi:hypothetical protein